MTPVGVFGGQRNIRSEARGGEGLGGVPVEVMFGAAGVKVRVPAGQAEQRKMRGGAARGRQGAGWRRGQAAV